MLNLVRTIGRLASRPYTVAVIVAVLFAPGAAAQQKSPGAGPIIVLETVKGTIEFETYPEEAPKTVARRAPSAVREGKCGLLQRVNS